MRTVTKRSRSHGESTVIELFGEHKNVNKISILLIDEKPVTMRGLSSLIGEQEDMEVVAEVGRYQDLSRKIGETLPNIALVDIDSSSPDCFENCRG